MDVILLIFSSWWVWALVWVEEFNLLPKRLHNCAERNRVKILEQKEIIESFSSQTMASQWIPLRSKIQNWILCLLIQVLATIQIAFLAVVFLFLFSFVYEDPFPVLGIPALGSIFFMSICLVSCILMEKVSLDYWKWKEEKTGRVLFQLCYVIGMVRYFNIREHSLMTSLVVWTFLTYLPTLSYSITSHFRGYLGPPTYPNIGHHKWMFLLMS